MSYINVHLRYHYQFYFGEVSRHCESFTYDYIYALPPLLLSHLLFCVFLVSKFQKQSLANYRKSTYPLNQPKFSNNHLFYNRNLLPDVLARIDRAANCKVNLIASCNFDLTIRLSDRSHVAQSSLFESNYLIKFYLFEHTNWNSNFSNLNQLDFKLVDEKEVKLTDKFIIRDIKPSKYLIEVS